MEIFTRSKGNKTLTMFFLKNLILTVKICLAYKLDYEMFKIHCENIIQALLLKSTLKLRTKLGLDQLGQGKYTYLERSQGIYTYLE